MFVHVEEGKYSYVLSVAKLEQIHTRAQLASLSQMNPNEYQKMFDLEDKYWWFIGRRKLLNRIVASHATADRSELLFDLGCGTGLNLISFAANCRVIGGDHAKAALEFCRSRDINSVFQCHSEAIPLANNSVNIVTALDVLEHFDDDVVAIREIHRVLKPGGLFISTVPAYRFLWSEHDEALHHRRRYTAPELKSKLDQSGFAIERTSYYISLLFFPIVFLRFWQKLSGISHQPSVSYIMPPRWINTLFVWLLDLEANIMRVTNLPFGISIVSIARKPGH